MIRPLQCLAARVSGLFETWLAALKRDAHLRPLPTFSRGIIWTLCGFTITMVLWFCLAQTEEIISAPGKLETSSATQEIQAPVAGVIELLHVADGQAVSKGEPLLRLDRSVPTALLASLESVKASLVEEVGFISDQMMDVLPPAGGERKEKLPAEIVALARDRANLLTENRIFRAQLVHSAEGAGLPEQQLAYFEAAENDRKARTRDASLAIEQVESQLPGSEAQLVQIEKLLENTRKVFAGYTALSKDRSVGSMETLARETDVIRAEVEVAKLKMGIATLQIELRKGREARDFIEINYRKEALAGIEKNVQRIAEIDARLSKSIVESRQRLAGIEGQITQLRATLAYHDLAAPVAGTVFELRQHKPGTVVVASETILKIVPNDILVARVFLPNRDVGFTRIGMPASVRVESYPFREFGDVEGTLAYVGSDVLPPSQTIPYFSFPARIALGDSHLRVHGQPGRLQSGMAVTVNLKIRKRSVLSIFIEATFRPMEKLREMR